MLIASDIVWWLWIFLLIVAIVIALWFGTHQSYESSRVHIFLEAITAMAIFIIVIFYYNVVITQADSQDVAARNEMLHLENEIFVGIIDDMNKTMSVIPDFVKSLCPLNYEREDEEDESEDSETDDVSFDMPDHIADQQDNSRIPPQSQPKPQSKLPSISKRRYSDHYSDQQITLVWTLSYRIFSSWQSMLTKRRNTESEVSYIANFLQRAHSAELRRQWRRLYPDFNRKTRLLAKLLFSATRHIQCTPRAYDNAAKMLVADERYTRLWCI